MNRTDRAAPTAYGTGFVALDVVVDLKAGTEARFAGGTCGNVLTILAFLGWRAVPIARLSNDSAGVLVREDLERWGVDLAQIGLEPVAPTPVVIEELYRNRAGLASHRYVWTCPHCGAYLPQFRAVLARSLEDRFTLKAPQVFFFDRVSRGAIDLAQRLARDGAIVVFEPSGSSDPRLFKDALRTCHILKYSSQRVRAFADLLGASNAWLEIETLGEEGLRYRTTLPLCSGRGWHDAPAFEVDDVKDAAGSGDWCTAGILSKLASRGQEELAVTTSDSLLSALRYGQALSAWNCRFPAPRGGMYFATRAAMAKAVEKIVSGSDSARCTRPVGHRWRNDGAAAFCPKCATPKSRQHAQMPEVLAGVGQHETKS
jgi:fructokinase